MRSSGGPMLLLLVGCGTTPPAQRAVTPPPIPFELEWDGPPGAANPQRGDVRFVVFPEDEWTRVLPCPRSLAAQQPTAPDRHRCAFPAASAIAVGGRTLWAAMTRVGHEFDGMYGTEEGVVLLDATAPTIPIATLSQWVLDVVDGQSTLRLRRHRTADLDGDGRTELCIESIDEIGVGLFDVMDLRDQDKLWVPITRTREVVAFAYDGTRLQRVPTLNGRCPRSGYSSFVSPLGPDDPGDPFGERRQVQEDGVW
jgi:hypothetical protein